jgi:hypothetical protein
MNGWTSEELSKIGTAEELRIRSLRRDGTLRSPTTIWVVRHGEDLYIRPVNGHTSGWFRGTQVRLEGHIQCGGVEKTSPSSLSTPVTNSTPRLMPRTAPSTAATPQVSSTRS